MSDLEVFQNLVKQINRLVFGYKKVRARTKDGRYKGDDPKTKNINEAWEIK
ncbi:MAG: hypothetical protein Tp1124DCM412261_11 [Prokaryotic dsDNA virus sp.]|nr:MAG: hypothetical protein Tp1123DCM939791_23 [Prokaryotic dsDNA virus sp.]QDP59843.1 MAG: hypothetical protein Tp1124DCM412261_11 [Prokaryotic dsDNA virus sp.]|tara:strand:- start:1089 stop:1241 length:153 start_codon:yes stop_codon:yes gene_type:complete